MRKSISGLVAVIILTLAPLLLSCKHTEPKASSQWRALFNGKSTNGWEMVGPGGFELKDGELITRGGMGMLWYSREKLGDCQIRVLFKPTGDKDNSGVFVRIPNPPKDPWEAVHGGYEVQIASHGDEWHRTGCLYSFSKAKAMVDTKVGEWNTMLITLDGPKTSVLVNGKLVTDFVEGQSVPEKKIWYEPNRGPRPQSGYIGLQNHNQKEVVHFKEVSVRSLR